MDESEVTNLGATETKEKALSLIGQGYIYGAKGQICSPAFRQQQAQQYPEKAENILGTGSKWDGVPVWDCAQLTRAAAAAGGVTLVSGATSQWTKTDWDETGEIDSIPENEILFLYRRQKGSSTTMQHTGVAIGDGTCVHARGTAYGVVRQDMQDYPWTHWARPKWTNEQTDDDPEVIDNMVQARVIGPAGETVNLRSMPSKSGTVKVRVRVGETVSAGADKNGWRSVAYNGLVGYMMAEYLRDVAETAPEELVTVTLPAEAARALMAAFEKVL